VLRTQTKELGNLEFRLQSSESLKVGENRRAFLVAVTIVRGNLNDWRFYELLNAVNVVVSGVS
jgi:hypothetical protein